MSRPQPMARTRRLVLAAVVLLAAALADPALTLDRPVYDVVVVLDITQSMNVVDYRLDGRPLSRLAYAKAGLQRALLELPCGSRIGWGVFSAYRVLLLSAPAEVCANYGELSGLLQRIDNRMAWTNASEIRKGLANGIAAVRALPDKPALVFISDGEEVPPANPRIELPFAPRDIVGALVGAGGLLGQPIPMSDPEGRALGLWQAQDVGPNAGLERSADGEVLSRLHPDHLAALAEESGFRYRRLDDPGDLAEILAQPAFARMQPSRVELGPLFAALALAATLAVFAAPVVARLRGGWGRRRTVAKTVRPAAPA